MRAEGGVFVALALPLLVALSFFVARDPRIRDAIRPRVSPSNEPRSPKRRRTPRPHPAPPAVASSPWTSRQACEAALASGARLERAKGSARLATWNLHWFPDGRPGKHLSSDGTDIAWLGCAIAFLDPDVIALSEIKNYPDARQKLEQLFADLARRTGAEFRVELDRCEPEAMQHVALAWNARRVRADEFTIYGELNPRRSACQDHLRPGLGGYFQFPGGLDLEVVAVHLKSGGERRAFELRARSFAATAEVRTRARARREDDDLVLLGDFNTMGCPQCSPPESPERELERLDRELGKTSADLRRLPVEPSCSHYFSGRATLLDLVVVSARMRELGSPPRARSAGLCAEQRCANVSDAQTSALRQRLSDHCPVVIDLVDRDLDE